MKMDPNEWRLVMAGAIPPMDTQTIWHAGAIAVSEGAIPNTLYIDWPNAPLVGCGFHQEIEKEVDLQFCEEEGILVARRQIGGGAVYLDGGQIFYHVVLHKDTPGIPKVVAEFYKFLLQAPIKAYNELGIPAVYKPVNDIIVDQRKISGNGAGVIEDAWVLCGNLILTFDYDTMVKVLKVPSEKFRDKLANSLREWITTIEREVGYVPSTDKCVDLIVKNFGETLKAKFTPDELTPREKELTDELNALYKTKERLFMPIRRHPNMERGRVVKVTGGVYVNESTYKSPGGLIRVTSEVKDGIIRDIMISGDFWFIPQESLPGLEEALTGLSLDEATLLRGIEGFYQENDIESPGTTPADFVKTILQSQE